MHRDLKPANIVLTKGGAKLLDFGLAKPAASKISAVSVTTGPTERRPLTTEGMIVGTFQYMAPEQLEGAEADARTDIFAFGALLYEMATGTRAFVGKTKTSLIAAIVDAEPQPMSEIQPLAPPAFERLVKACLAKDPDERWQTAHDVLLQLRWIAEGGSQAGVAAPMARRRKHREWSAWALAAFFVVSTFLFAWQWRRATAEPPRRVEVSVLTPQGARLVVAPPMLSPDGTRLLIPARDKEGVGRLWQRRLDNGASQTIPGTESAYLPFWSPDSRFIGFFANGKLQKIDSSGGPAQILAEVGSVGSGGSWGSEGTIVFAPTPRSPIQRVAASGGAPVAVTRLEKGETSHRFPSFLPDGKHFLYLAKNGDGLGTIVLGSVDGSVRKVLFDSTGSAVYSPLGFILHVRDGALVAHRFDPRKLELSPGDPSLIADGVRVNSYLALAAFSVSARGELAYQQAAGQLSQMVILDRSGKEIAKVGAPADILRPSWSHDGRRIAYEVADSQGLTDIWIHDIGRAAVTRFTFDSARESHAVWSPDDRWIAFVAERPGGVGREARRSLSNGAGRPEALFDAPLGELALTDWSADGQFLFYHASKTGTGLLEVGFYSFETKKAAPAPYITSQFGDSVPRLSPDGKWLAYNRAHLTRPDIFIQGFPAAGERWPISTAGGSQARWRRDGRELYYMNPDAKVMALEIRASGGSLEAGLPQELFTVRQKMGGGWQYDVSPDGQRFLVNQPLMDESEEPLTIVLNWASAL